MNSETALIFYYTKENRNSYNALAGAIEKYLDLKKLMYISFQMKNHFSRKYPPFYRITKK